MKLAVMRATTSVLPPAANGTMSLIGRLGQLSCAHAAVAPTSERTAASAQIRIRVTRFNISPLLDRLFV